MDRPKTWPGFDAPGSRLSADLKTTLQGGKHVASFNRGSEIFLAQVSRGIGRRLTGVVITVC